MRPKDLAWDQRRPSPPASRGTRRRRPPKTSSVCSGPRPALPSASTTTLCFDALRKLKSAPSASGAISAPEADHRRSGSPSADSTLITSAPPSARSFVQYPPAIHVERSTTRSPLSGGAAGLPFGVSVEGCRHRQSVSWCRRPEWLRRQSGGNPLSLSFTARFRPASIVSLLSVARLPSTSSRSIPPIDSSHALRRLPMYSPWCCSSPRRTPSA